MPDPKCQSVTLGCRVKVRGFGPDEEETFEIVPEDRANYLDNLIPPSSPLARALAGHTPGDVVPFETPTGAVELQVVEVGTAE